MAIVSQHWFNQNESNLYPVDDRATGVSLAGEPLPRAILVDLALRYPEDLGDSAYLAGITVSPGAASLTIEAHNSGSGASVPIAAVAVPRPLDPYRSYPLEALAAGVSGWVVFGDGVNRQPYTGRFDGPARSRLADKACRRHRVPRVTSLASFGAAAGLQGVVPIVSPPPIRLTRGTALVEGRVRQAIFFDLVGAVDVQAAAAVDTGPLNDATSPYSILQDFAGACGARPESRSCPDPQPVETVNGAGPDCDGVLTIEFQGCAVISKLESPCGVVIDCGRTQVAVCPVPYLPDEEGVLPADQPLPSPPPLTTTTPAPGPTTTTTTPDPDAVDPPELPHEECFVAAPADFEVLTGAFAADPEASDGVDGCDSMTRHAYQAVDVAQRNLAVWDDFDLLAVYRKASVDAKLVTAAPGSLYSAGAVLNLLPVTGATDRWTWFSAEIDGDSQTLRICRFNGTVNQVLASVTVAAMTLGVWYRIGLKAVPGSGSVVQLTATLSLAATPGSPLASIGPLNVNNYYPANGKSGLLANRAATKFGRFMVTYEAT